MGVVEVATSAAPPVFGAFFGVTTPLECDQDLWQR